MKIHKQKSERKCFTEKCGCGKIIKGFSESNLKYNMRLHKEKHLREKNAK